MCSKFGSSAACGCVVKCQSTSLLYSVKFRPLASHARRSYWMDQKFGGADCGAIIHFISRTAGYWIRSGGFCGMLASGGCGRTKHMQTAPIVVAAPRWAA